MKFWFSKKTPKDVYDVKAPYDAAVELALRVAQEVNAAAPDADRDVFDFAKALRPRSEPDLSPEFVAPEFIAPEFIAPELIAPPRELPALATTRPMVSRAARDEMERRIANYRAFQKKLNDDREARIRRTMDDVRAKLKQSAAPNPTQH